MRIDSRIPEPYLSYINQKKTIHLFGDSIFRGYALGVFADEVLPSHPLYGFRSIASMANLVLSENGNSDEFVYRGNLYGYPTAIQNILDLISTGTVVPGDVCVLEDAGNHNMLPSEYRTVFEAFRTACSQNHDVTVILMSMFDYPPAPVDCRFDEPFGGVTMNDAIRAAQSANLAVVGPSIYLDMNGRMDFESIYGPFRYGEYAVKWIFDDGIHPNVWGQMLMTGEILKASGYRKFLSRCETLKTIAEANKTTLGYGSPYLAAWPVANQVTHCIFR